MFLTAHKEAHRSPKFAGPAERAASSNGTHAAGGPDAGSGFVRLVGPVSSTVIDSTSVTLGQTGPGSGGLGTVCGSEPVTDSDPLSEGTETYISVPWAVWSVSLNLLAFDTRLTDQPLGLDPDSTQAPSVQGEQGKDVVESDDIHMPPGAAFGVGIPLSFRGVLTPDSLPRTGSRRVTFDRVALSNPQGKGVANAVSTQLHASLTPAPPASIPTHLVTAGPDPHASASGLSGLPTCGRPVCNAAAPVEIAIDRAGPWPPHQDTRDIDGAIPQQRLSSTFLGRPPRSHLPAL